MNNNLDYNSNNKYIEKEKNKNFKTSIILIVLLIVSIFFGYFYFFKDVPNNNNDNNVLQEKEYVITFLKNDALSIENNMLSCRTLENSCNITMPSITAKEGYEVLGWSENKNATTATYLVNQTYTINKNITLYAITKKIETTKEFIVNFQINNASSIGKDALSCKTLKDSCSITMPSITAKEGYEVLGWSENKNATTATYLVGNQYLISRNMTLYAILEETERFLSGTELTTFKNDNNINKSNNFVVKKTSKVISGVTFPFYYVYDQTQYNSSNMSNFELFVSHSLTNLAKVDKKILQKVASTGASLVFFGSHTCDAALASASEYTYAAYCNSINRNVVVGYEAKRLNWTYYEESVVHEMGHSFDFAMRYTIIGDTQAGISQLSQDNIMNGFYNRNNKFIESNKVNSLYVKDNNGNPYSWTILAKNDANNLKNKLTGFSAYSLEDLEKRPHEYFAEVFASYYSSTTKRNSLKSIAPNSYQGIEKIINNVN